MKLFKLWRLAESVEIIAEQTCDDIDVILHQLTGFCWDEEEAADIKYYIEDGE